MTTLAEQPTDDFEAACDAAEVQPFVYTCSGCSRPFQHAPVRRLGSNEVFCGVKCEADDRRDELAAIAEAARFNAAVRMQAPEFMMEPSAATVVKTHAALAGAMMSAVDSILA